MTNFHRYFKVFNHVQLFIEYLTKRKGYIIEILNYREHIFKFMLTTILPTIIIQVVEGSPQDFRSFLCRWCITVGLGLPLDKTIE